MSSRQPEWNRYEAVILLSAYLDSLSSTEPRSFFIQKTSTDLRNFAIKQGIEIDDIYRNVAGITFQMASMESAYLGYTVLKPATKLFSETVLLYKEHPSEFKLLLKEAREMVNTQKTNKEQFLEYLASKVSPTQLSAFYQSYEDIEKYCLRIKILSAPLLETTQLSTIKRVYKTISKDKLFISQYRKRHGIIVASCQFYLNYLKDNFDSNLVPQFKDASLPAGLEISDGSQSSEMVEKGSAMPSGKLSDNAPANQEFVVRSDQDKRLYAKYPIIYKRTFFALRELSDHCPRGVSISELYEHMNHVARCADIENILDNVSWARNEGRLFAFSNEPCERRVPITDTPASSRGDDKTTSSGTALGNGTSPSTKKQFSGNIEDDFKEFLRNSPKISPPTCRSYFSAVRVAERFAKEHHYKSAVLYTSNTDVVRATISELFSDPEFREYNTQQHNRFAVAIKKLLSFLGEEDFDFANLPIKPSVEPGKKSVEKVPYHNAKIEEILRDKFPKGFRYSSAIDCKKFRKYYQLQHGLELPISDEALAEEALKLCISYEDKAYHPDTIIKSDVRAALFSYIQNCFDSGKNSIYYQAIFEKFSEQFLDCCIYNPEMLKEYLDFENSGNYYVGRTQISIDGKETSDPVEELRVCLKASARPMTYDEIYDELPHIPKDKIRWLLSARDGFVWNSHGEYFHIDIFEISEDELESISEIIADSIKLSEFITGTELYDVIKAKLPQVIERNSTISVIGLRDALKYHLNDKFSFNAKIISAKGSNLSVDKIFADFCSSRDSFTLEEIKVLAEELGSSIYFNPIYENSLRISETHFVSRNQADFDTNSIDTALDSICPGAYISISKVYNFGVLPDVGFAWNEFLLEHYVAHFSQKYKLLSGGFNRSKCTGAIVKRNAHFDDFDALLTDAIANSDIEFDADVALNYLVEEGFISRRKYSGIEDLLIRAKAQRNMKGAN